MPVQTRIRTCTNVVPVGVIRSKLLEGAGLDEINPGRHLELARTLQVGCVCGDEGLRTIPRRKSYGQIHACLPLARRQDESMRTHLMSRTFGILDGGGKRREITLRTGGRAAGASLAAVRGLGESGKN